MASARQPSARLIGIFVVGAVALAMVILLAFGGGDIFHRKLRAVAYFQGSVQGLTVGAPVSFRGVPVGSVTSIRLRLDMRSLQTLIPVYMEFNTDNVTYVDGVNERLPLAAAIEKGLRAQLVAQSFVTGQLMVEINFHPGTPVHLVGLDKSVPEIPTIKSPLEQVQETLERLPIQELAQSIDHAVRTFDSLLSSPRLEETVTNVAQASQQLADILNELRKEVGPAASALTQVSGDARQTLGHLDQAIDELRATLAALRQGADQTGPALADTRKTLQAAEAALAQARASFAALNGMIGPGSPQRQDIDRTIGNMSEATRALKDLAEELRRNPNSLLLGRGSRQ